MSIQNNELPNNPTIESETVKPFRRFCTTIMTIGSLPSSYQEAMSYQEMLLWLCDFIENKVIPAFDNNANAITELQNLYVELKSYVDNYFTNLDVQQEINNKLDQMAEDGTLTNLIKNYVDPIINEQYINFENQINSINSKLSGLTTSTPIAVTSIEQMTDKSKIYLLVSSNTWYYWDTVQNNWLSGGTYQATNNTQLQMIINAVANGYSGNNNDISLWEEGSINGTASPYRIRTKTYLPSTINKIVSINNYYFRVFKYNKETEELILPDSGLVNNFTDFDYSNYNYKIDLQYSNTGLTNEITLNDSVNILFPYGNVDFSSNPLNINSVVKQLITPFFRFTFNYPNYDTETKILTFYSLSQIFWDFNKYIDISGEIDLSSYETNPVILYFDMSEYKIKATGYKQEIFNQNILIIGTLNTITGLGNLCFPFTVNKKSNQTLTGLDSAYFFSVPVNQTFLPNSNLNEIEDSENFENVNCVLYLPTNYKETGIPSKLVFSAHGAGRSITENNAGNLADYYNIYTSNGYAVFDVNGSNQNNFQNMGSPRTISAVKKAYDFITQNFNVEKTLYLQGLSMGGLTVCNFANHYPELVNCIALWHGCTNLYGQAWLNPWNTTGGEGTFPTKKCIAIEYNFEDKTGNSWEGEKVVGYNPIENATKNIPIRIWHGTKDEAVSYDGSVEFINMLRQNGCDATLRTIIDGIHQTNDVYYNETIMYFNRH